MRITLRVTENVQLGIAKLGAAIEDISDDEIDAGLEEARLEILGDYPTGSNGGYNIPPTAKQTYVRTGNLGASTYVMREGRSYRFQSNAISRNGRPYSTYVLGDGAGAGQAGVHRGRWPVAYVVIERFANAIAQDIDGRIGEVAKTL